MSRFPLAARGFVHDDRAATLIEYALMLALIAIVCIAAVRVVGSNTSALFNNASSEIATVVP